MGKGVRRHNISEIGNGWRNPGQNISDFIIIYIVYLELVKERQFSPTLSLLPPSSIILFLRSFGLEIIPKVLWTRRRLGELDLEGYSKWFILIKLGLVILPRKPPLAQHFFYKWSVLGSGYFICFNIFNPYHWHSFHCLITGMWPSYSSSFGTSTSPFQGPG